MKGRFLFFLLLFLDVFLFSQEHLPSPSVCMDLMRRGTAFEVEQFLQTYGDVPALKDSLGDYLYQAAFWNKDSAVAESLYSRGADINYRNESGRTPLMAACRRNSFLMVKTLLSLGADPGLQDRNGQTAFHFAAAYSEDARICLVLYNFGAPCAAEDRTLRTPLELAILRQGNLEVLQTVMQLVPNLNDPLSSGNSFYSLAMREEDPAVRSDIIEALFQEGASLRMTNSLGLTPLEEAERYGYSQVVHELTIYQEQLQDELLWELELFSEDSPPFSGIQNLLVRGADPIGLNRDGLTPCQLAVISGAPEILSLLLEYSDVPHPFQFGLEEFNRHLLFFALTHPPEQALALTDILLNQGLSPDGINPDGNPLLAESLYNSLAVTERLLQGGADTEIRDGFGATPLMRAGALENGADALELLIRYGADFNAVDEDHWNVLFYTVLFGGDIPAIQVLIDKGIDLNDRDDYGSSIMLWAAAYLSDPAILEFLASQGASLTSRDKDGWVPLMSAINWTNDPKIISYLIDQTPDGRITDGTGRSFEEITRLYEEKSGKPAPEALRALRNKRVYPPDSIPAADLNASLLEVAEWGDDPGMVARLLAAGGDINCRDENSWTPLMKAAAFNDSAMVDAVLEAGGEAQAQTDRGWTALHMASWSDDPRTVSLLIQAGVAADQPDQEGWTPFLWAARNQAPVATLQLLLDAGAPIGDLSNKGESALLLLVSGWIPPEEGILNLLLSAGSDPNLPNTAGTTPLMKGAAQGYETALRLLLDAGADSSAKDNDGNTAIDYALSKGLYQIADLLNTSGIPLPEEE